MIYNHYATILTPCYSGAVTLSPPGVAPVCSGGQLELTCTTTGEFLRWRFRAFRGNETISTEFTRTIASTVSAETISDLTVNSTVFNFSRTSARDSLPVISRLVIDPVSSGLNGTVINCVDLDTAESSATTIITGERSSLQGNHNGIFSLLYYVTIIYVTTKKIIRTP